MAITIHPEGTPPPQPTTQAFAPAAPAAEAPSQALTKAANVIRYVTDENGRQIGWRRLNALEDFDLTEIAGSNASNEEWMLRATIAFGVRSIDGEAVSRPANKQQLRAMVARLDDAGMAAILAMFQSAVESADTEDGENRSKN